VRLQHEGRLRAEEAHRQGERGLGVRDEQRVDRVRAHAVGREHHLGGRRIGGQRQDELRERVKLVTIEERVGTIHPHQREGVQVALARRQ